MRCKKRVWIPYDSSNHCRMEENMIKTDPEKQIKP